MAQVIYTAELSGYNLETDVVETLRYSTLGWATAAGDTPADTHYPGRIKAGLDIGRWMFAPAKTRGRSRKDVGDMILHNADSGLDELNDYAFDGRTIRVYRGEDDGFGVWPTYPSGFVQIFDGTIEQVEVDRDEVRVKVRNHQELLDHDAQKSLYLGDNDVDIVTNGAYAADTDWLKGIGWAISGGTANGTATGATSNLTQDPTDYGFLALIPGRAYEVTFVYTHNTQGRVRAYLGGTLGTERSASGTYVETLIAGEDGLIGFQQNDTGGSWNGDVDDLVIVAALPIEGDDSIKGKPRPLCFGKVKNIQPVLVNPSRLIYQVADSPVASVDAVRDRGVALAVGDVSWNDLSIGFNREPHGCRWSDFHDAFFAVGQSFLNSYTIAKSTDGVNWNTILSPFSSDHTLRDIEISPSGVIIAAGSSSVSDEVMVRSFDGGGTWEDISANSAAAGGQLLYAVTVGPGEGAAGADRWIAVGEDGWIETSDDDGENWTSRSLSGTWLGTDDVTTVWYGNGVFMLGSRDGGELETSPDAITWTHRTPSGWGTANGIFTISYSADLARWVIAGQVGEIGYSDDDGVNWTSVDTSVVLDGAEFVQSVIWVSDLNAYLGNVERDTAGEDGVFIMSPDGINWARHSTGLRTNQLPDGHKLLAYHPTLGRIILLASNNGIGDLSSYAEPFGLTYTSLDDLIFGIQPPPGGAGVFEAGGYIRLGSSPDGTVTADVTEGAAAANRTVAQVWLRSLLNMERVPTARYGTDKDFGTWTLSGVALTEGLRDHRGGLNAAQFADDSASMETAWDDLGGSNLPDGEQFVVEIIFKEGDVWPANDEQIISLEDNGAGPASLGSFHLTEWVDGLPAYSFENGAVFLNYSRMDFGFHRVRYLSTKVVNFTNTHLLRINPAGDSFNSDQGSIILSEVSIYAIPWVEDDLAILDAINSGVVGHFAGTKTRLDAIISEVADSLGAGWWSDRVGRFRLRQLRDPRLFPYDADANLISNGDFATDTLWAKGTGWAISGGNASNGTNATDISQECFPALKPEVFYDVVFEISGWTTGDLTPNVGGRAGTAVAANGDFRQTIRADEVDNLLAFSASAAWDGSLDDVTITQRSYDGEFTEDQMVVPMKRLGTTDAHAGIPIYRQTVRYSRNFTPGQELAAGATDALREELAQEWKSEVQSDLGIKDKFLMSVEQDDSSLLTAAADAKTEATRRLLMRKRKRDRYQFTVPLTAISSRLDIGGVISVSHPRYAPAGIQRNDDWELPVPFLANMSGEKGFMHVQGESARLLRVNPLTGAQQSPGWFIVSGHSPAGSMWDGTDLWIWDSVAETVRQLDGFSNSVLNTYDFSANADVNGGNFRGSWVDVPNQRIYAASFVDENIIRGTASFGVTTDVLVDVGPDVGGLAGFTFDPDGNLTVMDDSLANIYIYEGFSDTLIRTIPLPVDLADLTTVGVSFNRDGDICFTVTTGGGGMYVTMGKTNAIRHYTSPSSFWNVGSNYVNCEQWSFGKKLVVIGLRVDSKNHTVQITGWG